MFQQSALGFWISTLSKKGLDQAEQICTLCVHMFISLSCTVQLPGASQGSVFKPITEELQGICYALIVPIDD